MNPKRLLCLMAFFVLQTGVSLVFGQGSGQNSGPGSILARFPYLPEDRPPSLLDVEGALRDLPELTLNYDGLFMPEHLLHSPAERVWVARLREGHEHIQFRRHQEARTIFEEFLGAYPDHPPTRLALGDTYFSLRDYAAAEAQYLAFLEDFPQNFQALNNLAWLYATSDDPNFRRPETALRMAQRAMLVEPNSHHVWSTLSEAHYANQNHEEATRAAGIALNIARQTDASPMVLINYMNQLEKCQRALQATQIIE